MSNATPCTLFSGRTPLGRTARAVLGIVTITAATVLFAPNDAGVEAQTLTAPGPKAGSPQPRPDPADKLSYKHAKKRNNACSNFGLGFVQVPGTDACVKIGGGVTTEGTIGRGD